MLCGPAAWVTCKARDLGLIPGLGRSPGEGKGYPLQYSDLENSMDCIVRGGRKESDTTERFSLSLMRMIPILWMRKLRHQAGKQLAQSHTGSSE